METTTQPPVDPLSYDPTADQDPKPLSSNDSKIDRLNNSFKLDRTKWTQKILKYAKTFSNPQQLSLTQVNLYSDRQIIVEKLSALNDKYAIYNKKHIEMKSIALDKYTQKTDYLYKYNEKTIKIGNEVKELQYILDILNIQIQFLKETISTIDKMIYGIKNAIDLKI